jgi:hypothetical protein
VIFSVNALVLAKTTVVRVGFHQGFHDELERRRAGGQRGLDHPARARRTDEEPRDRLGRPARGREPQPRRVALRARGKPFE